MSATSTPKYVAPADGKDTICRPGRRLAGNEPRHPWGIVIAFQIPALTFYAAFTAYPVVRTLWNSVHKVLPRRESFVGLDNYVALAGDELFWRAYLMRWFDQQQFARVAPQAASLKAVVLSTFMFMLVHPQWLAAIVAGLAYAWLYRRQGRLWTAVIAHGVTNGVLGAWVIGTGRWQFW